MKKLFYASALACLFSSCGGNDTPSGSIMDESKEVQTNNEAAAGTDTTKQEATMAIGLWPSAGLYDNADKGAKWVKSVTFGSTFEVIETKEADDKKEYAKIKLIDGTEGWVSTYVIAQNAYIAVCTSEASLYKAADILALADKKVAFGEFIAVNNEKVGNFIYVQTSKKQKSGYIKSDKYLSTDLTNIEVALLRQRALEKEGPEKIEAIQTILDNKEYEVSVFYQDLKNMIEVVEPSKVEEPVIELDHSEEEMEDAALDISDL